MNATPPPSKHNPVMWLLARLLMVIGLCIFVGGMGLLVLWGVFMGCSITFGLAKGQDFWPTAAICGASAAAGIGAFFWGYSLRDKERRGLL